MQGVNSKEELVPLERPDTKEIHHPSLPPGYLRHWSIICFRLMVDLIILHNIQGLMVKAFKEKQKNLD